MRNLVPLKVKIELTGQGQHKYPNFNILPSVQTARIDWSHYIDIHGSGWHYDKCCGHEVETPESPAGVQYGVLLVPKSFADEAVLLFPDKCVKLTEAEFQPFYDVHAHGHEPDEQIHLEVLQEIDMKKRFGIPLTAQQTLALDVTNDVRGIRKNKRRFWVDYKAMRGISIVQ